MPKNYKLKNGNYLKIDKTTNGIEYSYYTNNKKLIDGGIIDDEGIVDRLILEFILKMIFLKPDEAGAIEINEEIEENV